MGARLRSALFWFSIAALLLYRPLFALGIPFSAFPNAAYDDGLFLRMALDLRDGNWLGGYTPLTLCKGPFYPMFIAAVTRLGMPLTVMEQAFYAVVALIAAWAVRPVISNRWLLLGGFALLILNAYSWGPLPARLTRDPLAAQLSLLCIAGVVGTIFRRQGGIADLLIWGGLAGVAGAACWMTREEGIWIVAPAGMLLAIGAATVIREHHPRPFARASLMLLVPLVAGVLPVLSVCEKNRQCYDVFAVVDLKATAFADAYGALLRVGQKHHRHYVPVPTAARQAMYEISPTFRRLQPLLEGEVGQRWMLRRQMPDPQDIQGGWFIWAFREAAQEVSGVVGGPPLEFYRKVADEVNAACDAGLIEAGPKRSGLVTPLHPDDMPALREAAAQNLLALLYWPSYAGDAFSADDSSRGALLIRDLVRMPLTGPVNLHMVDGWACAADGPLTMALLRSDGQTAKYKPQWLMSPDVAEHLRASGRDWPAASECRFSHPAPRNATHLLLYRADREVGRVPLRTENRVLLSDSVAASVDSFTRRPTPVVPRHKRQFQLFVSEGARYLASALTAVSLAWFILGAITIRRNFLWFCITGAVAGAVLARSALLAYLDATTYPVYEQRYIEPTYTVLAYLLFLSVCALWQHFTRQATASTIPSTSTIPGTIAQK